MSPSMRAANTVAADMSGNTIAGNNPFADKFGCESRELADIRAGCIPEKMLCY
jgi:hypothetical protein